MSSCEYELIMDYLRKSNVKEAKQYYLRCKKETIFSENEKAKLDKVVLNSTELPIEDTLKNIPVHRIYKLLKDSGSLTKNQIEEYEKLLNSKE